ncbi:hypothetical protein PIB30_041174 [Stylosanthes scabra]|uniref:Ubiquinol oxidase n=1 Tax=Stylosanthes scabra TaxID=79078 RepID=A0ABU6WD78_9FABA|nr:hypothetical protein [Stylosanthes scabra]
METEIISDEDIVDVAATKKVAEIFFDRLLEMVRGRDNLTLSIGHDVLEVGMLQVDKGNIENVAAPAIAMDYWQLPPDSTLRDVVVVVRADEAHHRDVNHFASDVHYQGRELRETPAPIGYH